MELGTILTFISNFSESSQSRIDKKDLPYLSLQRYFFMLIIGDFFYVLN